MCVCVYLCQSVRLRVCGGSGECLYGVYGMCGLEVASAETAVSHTSGGLSHAPLHLAWELCVIYSCSLVDEGAPHDSGMGQLLRA